MMRYLILLAMFFSFDARAQIYKCKSSDGQTIYQQMPCQGSSNVGVIKADSDVPLEEQLRARERHLKIKEENHKVAEEKMLEAQRREKASIVYRETERLRQEERDAPRKKYLKALEDERNRQMEQRKLNALEEIARNSNQNSNRTLHCRPDYAGGAYCN